MAKQKKEYQYRLLDIALNKDAKILGRDAYESYYYEGGWFKTRTYIKYIVHINGGLFDIGLGRWCGKKANSTYRGSENRVSVYSSSGNLMPGEIFKDHEIKCNRIAMIAMRIRYMLQRAPNIDAEKILFAYQVVSDNYVTAQPGHTSFVAGTGNRSVATTIGRHDGYIMRDGNRIPLNDHEYDIVYPMMHNSAYDRALDALRRERGGNKR